MPHLGEALEKEFLKRIRDDQRLPLFNSFVAEVGYTGDLASFNTIYTRQAGEGLDRPLVSCPRPGLLSRQEALSGGDGAPTARQRGFRARSVAPEHLYSLGRRLRLDQPACLARGIHLRPRGVHGLTRASSATPGASGHAGRRRASAAWYGCLSRRRRSAARGSARPARLPAHGCPGAAHSVERPRRSTRRASAGSHHRNRSSLTQQPRAGEAGRGWQPQRGAGRLRRLVTCQSGVLYNYQRRGCLLTSRCCERPRVSR